MIKEQLEKIKIKKGRTVYLKQFIHDHDNDIMSYDELVKREDQLYTISQFKTHQEVIIDYHYDEGTKEFNQLIPFEPRDYDNAYSEEIYKANNKYYVLKNKQEDKFYFGNDTVTLVFGSVSFKYKNDYNSCKPLIIDIPRDKIFIMIYDYKIVFEDKSLEVKGVCDKDRKEGDQLMRVFIPDEQQSFIQKLFNKVYN